MIDTHVHALPAIALAPGSRTAHELLATVVNRVTPSRAPLEIGSVALLDRVLPSIGFAAVEAVAHAGVLPAALAGGTVQGLLSSMARHGVDRSVLIGARGRIPNAWVLDAASRSDGRLVPVTTMPLLSRRDATLDEWTAAYTELAEAGAAGFKIHPNWDGVLPGHPSYEAAFSVAAEHDRFIIVHTGCFHVPTYKERDPIVPGDLRPYFERFPEVRVCLAHMNRHDPQAVWDLQAEFEQVYTDTSWQPSSVIRRALDTVGSHRVMLGSDWPLLHLGLQRDAIRQAQSAASGVELRGLVHDTPTAFIGTVPSC